MAQSVRGQLTDSITRTPIPGAFLTLVDDHGVERARTITNASGEFFLTAPATGSYRLRSKRIGFHPYLSTVLTLRVGEVSSFNAAVDPIPVALEQVVVEGQRQCDIESGAGASVAALWDEVREALAAVAWTARLPGYWYDIAHFQRELTTSLRRDATVPDSIWRKLGYQQVPFRSAPPELLESQGFVISEDDGGYSYWAPDAEALMSTPFLRSHCFETVNGRDEMRGLVGLAFSPARGRHLPDIQGALWIDRQSAELREIDYTYTRLPEDLVAPRAGGHIEFLKLPSGTWIVRDWVIRMPRAVMKQRAMAMGTELVVSGYREEGGNLVEIKTRTGTVVYHSDSLAAVLAAVPTDATPGQAAPITPVALTPIPAPSMPAASQAPPSPAEQQADAAPHRMVRRPNLISSDEVVSSTALDAYSLVQELRPTWLRSRGPISFADPTAGDVQVYLDGQRFGDLSKLREISRRDIREVRFYGASEAQMRFGVGHAGGVIDVATGAIAPTGPIARSPNPAPPPPPPTAASDSAPAAAPRSTAEAIADTLTRGVQARRRRLAYNQNVLTPEEFEGWSPSDVFSLIQHFRPNWLLRNRGPVSIYNPSAGDVKVYLNGVSAGDLSRLHEFRSEDVRELRFLSAGEAQQRYGAGNAGGVIEVYTK